ncbi:band-7-like membrane protein [Mycobacterium phage prophiT49-2]|nr:band-7-like membrane protein [Mycobacterium phage prophiT49-2]
MPPTMWITLILLIVAGIAVIATPIAPREERHIPLLTAAGAGVFALIFGIFASITTVGTRQIGIETTFGRPNGSTLSNGLHFKAPWANVTEMDGAIQIDQHKGDNRIKVRLGNSSTADADVSVRWQIK